MIEEKGLRLRIHHHTAPQSIIEIEITLSFVCITIERRKEFISTEGSVLTDTFFTGGFKSDRHRRHGLIFHTIDNTDGNRRN